ncbi:MAG: hypothetical protein ABWZ79_21575 [Pedobacter agri]
MSNANNNRDLFEFITKVYKSSVKKSLEVPKEEISNLLKELINTHSKKYNLRTNSSVNDIKYYDLKSRVKEEDSFSEKLIRKDIGLVITHKHGRTVSDLKRSRVPIINDLKKLDDIIGIRIVTELKKDCDNVYKLLLDNISFLEDNEIQLHDLDDQPQEMKNGLEIFRIKGTYQDHICFELQIKSKIDEAWGEMDHTIFYKDHTSTPIKDTVQATMNNIGHLLEKIEDLLFDLRESDKKFEANNPYNAFQIKISKELSEKLKTVFGASVDLKEYTKALYFLKNKIIKSKGIDNSDLSFEHLKYEITDPNLKYFAEAKSKSHKLIITEGIFYNILRTQDNKFKLKQENYNDSFKKFYSHYIDYLISDVMEIQEFENLLVTNGKFISDPDLFVNIKKLKKFTSIKEHLTNTFEDDPNAKALLTNLFFIQQYSGDIQTYLESILEDLEFDLSRKILQIQKATKELPDSPLKKDWIRDFQQFLEIINKINTEG